ncbi:uncharacterized protein LOC133037124 [Cannabis sativa]|uniref:uncharacterized protein LOC133037124 n=1 Tax=Cannabis sativa TaxID=3483 RepID=UPI0029CA1514|nr:uncharacterized protein LOC133037124 [Cannabis sativa]
MQLPPKVKIFAWKAINDALPVATSLVKRKVITDATCSVCQQAWESIGHALFTCTYARAVWRHSGLLFDWRLSSATYKGDYICHLSTIYSKPEMEQIMCTLWAIWTERNQVVHNKKAKLAQATASFALTYLNNYKSAQSKYQPAASSDFSNQQLQQHLLPTVRPPAAPPWQPPPAGAFKLNVDAAVDTSKNVTGVGAVIRASSGSVIAALSKQLVGNFKSHEMEALALFHSLNWALQQQLPLSQVETDALMVATALQAPFNSKSAFNDILVDISCLLSFFPNVTVSHVKRTANQAAHGLAKFALGVDETCYWFEDIPHPIYSVIVDELFV